MDKFNGFHSRHLMVGLLAALACSAAAPLSVSAADSNPPDLWAGGSGWNHLGRTNPERVLNDFIPVPGSPRPVTFDPAHPYVPNNDDGVASTFRVPDISNPNLTQLAKDALKKDADAIANGFLMYNRTARCWEPGVPVLDVSPGTTYFIQTPKEVIIYWQYDQIARHVYMNVAHSRNPKPSWNGESVGHYEGDTLVVDTIGISTKAFTDNYRTPHSDQLHLIERFRKYDNGTKLELEMTIDDPAAFVKPWKALHRYEVNTFRAKNFGMAEERRCMDGELPNKLNVTAADRLEPLPIAEKPDF